MASIREVEPEQDAEGIVALEREARPTIVTSPAAWLHRELTIPARAQLRAWVAEDDGRIVGESYALLTFFSESSERALVGVTVTESHRRQGLGARLFELASDHAAAIGATSELAKFHENDAGVAFAGARGFAEVRAEAESAVDPRTISERPPVDVDLRRVSEVEPKLVHAVDLEATRDMPATEPVDDIPYAEWEQHVLQHPLFTPEGSFVAMVDGVAAAVSLIIADQGSRRATSMFTGTLRAYRGRGLARAVKLASIEWLVAKGITQLVTTNDETNAPMLAVNRRLGYRPAGRRVDYLRPAETTSASASVASVAAPSASPVAPPSHER
jgi:GNAT superfamily N-acetyltransferase